MYYSLRAIKYLQCTREMYAAVTDPISTVKVTEKPYQWNPLGREAHGNRPQDKAHRKGIKDYLETVEDFVIGAVILYALPSDIAFTPDPDQEEQPIQSGTLKLGISAKFDVGDGQHRLGAYSDIMAQHDEDDPIIERLRRSGQPIIIVVESDTLRRAQDFADLQRNVKPPTASLGMSMDRRQPINSFVVKLAQHPELKLFNGGHRIEFLKDSPGKLSAKIMSFKTLRYFVGTVLMGVADRSTKRWEARGNDLVASDRGSEMLDDMVLLFKGLEQIPGWAEVIQGSSTMADIRLATFLGSAGVLYAVAYAIHLANQEDKESYDKIARAVCEVDFTRPSRTPKLEDVSTYLTKEDSIFAGSIIDPKTGKVGSGRLAWEAAAWDFRDAILTRNKSLSSNSAGENSGLDDQPSTSGEQNLQTHIEEILKENGEPLHINKLRRLLTKRGAALPGEGEEASIILHLRKGNSKFVRTGKGTYGLRAWDIPEVAPSKKRKVQRTRVRKN